MSSQHKGGTNINRNPETQFHKERFYVLFFTVSFQMNSTRFLSSIFEHSLHINYPKTHTHTHTNHVNDLQQCEAEFHDDGRRVVEDGSLQAIVVHHQVAVQLPLVHAAMATWTNNGMERV